LSVLLSLICSVLSSYFEGNISANLVQTLVFYSPVSVFCHSRFRFQQTAFKQLKEKGQIAQGSPFNQIRISIPGNFGHLTVSAFLPRRQ
ncbi:hypothetical protein, partial [Neisseria gonorrhoeae]